MAEQSHFKTWAATSLNETAFPAEVESKGINGPYSLNPTKEYIDYGARHLELLIWILLCRKSKIFQVGNKKRNTHTGSHTQKTKKSQTLTNILRASCLCGSCGASKIHGRGSLSLLEHLTLKSSLTAFLSLSDPVHLSVPVMRELAPPPKSLGK